MDKRKIMEMRCLVAVIVTMFGLWEPFSIKAEARGWDGAGYGAEINQFQPENSVESQSGNMFSEEAVTAADDLAAEKESRTEGMYEREISGNLILFCAVAALIISCLVPVVLIIKRIYESLINRKEEKIQNMTDTVSKDIVKISEELKRLEESYGELLEAFEKENKYLREELDKIRESADIQLKANVERKRTAAVQPAGQSDGGGKVRSEAVPDEQAVKPSGKYLEWEKNTVTARMIVKDAALKIPYILYTDNTVAIEDVGNSAPQYDLSTFDEDGLFELFSVRVDGKQVAKESVDQEKEDYLRLERVKKKAKVEIEDGIAKTKEKGILEFSRQGK